MHCVTAAFFQTSLLQTPFFQTSTRLFLVWIFVATPCGWVGENAPGQRINAPQSPHQKAERPNIVVFMVDDMGMMDSSVPFLTDETGNPKSYPLNQFYRTPQMQRLAEQGIRFNSYYSMSVCSPTRMSLLTGQNAARHRTTTWIDPYQNNRTLQGPRDWNWTGMRANQTALQRLLKEAGYRTIYVGKAHLGPFKHEGADPTKLGFDINIGGSAIGHPGSYAGQRKYGAGGTHAVPYLDEFHGTEVHLTEALTRKAKQQISEVVKTGKPFYLQLSHYAVHAPFESDPRYAANYKDSGKPQPAQNFATLVEGMDDSLGQVLDHLNDLGIADNTLVVFLGDNGTDAPLGGPHEIACAAPLRGKKGSQYEGGVRAPLMVSWAKLDPSLPHQKRIQIRSGAVNSQLVTVCDLMPTILEVTQVAAPENYVMDGQSIRALLSGERDLNRNEEFLLHFPHGLHRDNYFTTFRQEEWKVIYHYFPQQGVAAQRYQLYNLKSDPSESRNLAESNPEKLSEMMRGMAERLKEQGALFPISKEDQPLEPVVPESFEKN